MGQRQASTTTRKARQVAQTDTAQERELPSVVIQRVAPSRRVLMVSQEEACAALGFSRWIFERERDDGRITVVPVGGRRMVAWAELVRYVKALYEEAGAPLDDMALAG